ncbi:MAG: TonB-dependent receptor [Oceanococcaceae bacterium]
MPGRRPPRAASAVIAGVIGLVASAGPLATAATPAADPVNLPPVQVVGNRLDRMLQQTAGAVTLVDGPALRTQLSVGLAESLTRVPGVHLQNRGNFAQGERISMRGFGSRAPFGVRGIRIIVDGFPETLPDGQSPLDALDLDSATRIEVLRGPASAQYGNAGGGVILLQTRDGTAADAGPYALIRGGSDGFHRTTVGTGGRSDAGNIHINLSHLEREGARAQNAARRTRLNLRGGRDLDAQQRVDVALTVVDLPRAEDPGGLTAAQLRTDPRQAARFSTLLNAGKQVEQQRLGVRYRHDDIGPGTLRIDAFAQQRDFIQQLPFPGPSRVGFARDFYGLGVDYQFATQAGGRPLRLLIGIEQQQQRDDRQRQRVAASGTVGDTIQRERQSADSTGIHAQLDLDLTARTTLNVGLRHDQLRLSIRDRLLDDGDASGARRFSEISGSIGLTGPAPEQGQWFIRVGSVFESPTFTEFARPDGSSGFNPALMPQTALSVDLGWRNNPRDRTHVELTLFGARVADEITPFVVDERTVYQNAGRTHRAGIEWLLRHQLAADWTATVSATWARYRFQRFIDADGSVQDGNTLPGIPQQSGFAELSWNHAGHFAALGMRLTGKQYADNANRQRSPGQVEVTLRGEWSLHDARPRGGPLVQLQGRVDNLLDADGVDNIRINANPDRDLADRAFFEPVTGRQMYLGLALRW